MSHIPQDRFDNQQDQADNQDRDADQAAQTSQQDELNEALRRIPSDPHNEEAIEKPRT